MELNSIPKSGSYGAGVDLHNDNYQKIGVELQTLRELGQNEKGYFEDLSSLQSKYPTPLSGWQAYVKDAGSSTGYYVANVNSSGNWVVTAAEAPPINVDLAGYAKTGGSSKTLKQVDDEIVQLAGDFTKFVLGEDIDLETKPALTDGYYINPTGDLATTVPTAYSATLDFIPLYGAKKLHYFGRFGNSSTRLVFYSETSRSSRVLTVPQSDRQIFDEIFDVPSEAKYYRVTCGVNAKNNFKVVLIGVGSSLNLESFRYVGAPVYENDAIKQSNIIWNDGSSGVVIFNDWNEENLTFTSFVATSIENGVTVTQPPVTFNSNNQITNYPNFIISEI